LGALGRRGPRFGSAVDAAPDAAAEARGGIGGSAADAAGFAGGGSTGSALDPALGVVSGDASAGGLGTGGVAAQSKPATRNTAAPTAGSHIGVRGSAWGGGLQFTGSIMACLRD